MARSLQERAAVHRVVRQESHDEDADVGLGQEVDEGKGISRDVQTNEVLQELSDQELYELINAANFLNITRLFDAASKKVAELLTGRTFEQMSIILNCGDTPNSEDDEDASNNTEPAWRRKVARQSARIMQYRAEQASNSGF